MFAAHRIVLFSTLGLVACAAESPGDLCERASELIEECTGAAPAECVDSDDAADEWVRGPASPLLVGRRPARGTKARGILYRRAALMAQAHLCSISHAVPGSN